MEQMLSEDQIKNLKDMLFSEDQTDIELAADIIEKHFSDEEKNKLTDLVVNSPKMFNWGGKLWAVKINGKIVSCGKKRLTTFSSKKAAEAALSRSCTMMIGSINDMKILGNRDIFDPTIHHPIKTWRPKNDGSGGYYSKVIPYKYLLWKRFEGSGLKMRNYLIKSRIATIVNINDE